MGDVGKIVREFITKPDRRFIYLARWGFLHSMPDEKYLRRRFKIRVGHELNLENPRTYNEKLQWLKLHDRNPDYPKMVDKYEAKKYVAEKLGPQYIIPTLGVWEHFDEIDFDALPAQFVLKCTHDCDSAVIVKDKAQMDKKAARKKLEKALRQNFYWKCREWVYKDIQPRIIAEKYMCDSADDSDNLTDYKFFCFHGVPKYIMTVRDRQKGYENSTHRVYDTDWNLTDMNFDWWDGEKEPEQRPEQLDKMLEIAAALSSGIKHLRVDLYVVDGAIYFGELTFYSFAGFTALKPAKWDDIWGSYIHLDGVDAPAGGNL